MYKRLISALTVVKEQISAKDNLSNQLTADVTAREDMIRSLQDENGQLTSELAGTRHKLDKTSRKLNSQIANLKSREKHLSSNLKSLHKYVGKVRPTRRRLLE